MRDKVLPILKARLGITSNVRDTYLLAIIDGAISELETGKGIVLSDTDYHHIIFLVDFCAWKYKSVDTKEGMPRFIQYALHNLILKERARI